MKVQFRNIGVEFAASSILNCSDWLIYPQILPFHKVEAFFEAAREDVDLQLKLRQEGIVFFLHLLGEAHGGGGG